MWQLFAPSMNARDVAKRFVSEYWDEPRKIANGSFKELLDGGRCIGSQFRLVNGFRSYSVTCDKSGLYTVSNIQDKEV